MKVDIYQYKKGTRFSALVKKYDISDLEIDLEKKDQMLYLGRQGKKEYFPYDADYIVILNGKYEYRIDAIEPGLATTGCLLANGMVNNRCRMQSRIYDFDARCAIPAHDELNLPLPQK